MIRRVVWSTAIGALTAACFAFGFVAVAAPASRVAAYYLRRVEDKTSSKGEVQ